MEPQALDPPSGKTLDQLYYIDLLVLRTPRTGSRGTPIRVRSDIQTDRRVRQEFAPGAAGDVGGVPSSEVSLSWNLSQNLVKGLLRNLTNLNKCALFRSEG